VIIFNTILARDKNYFKKGILKKNTQFVLFSHRVEIFV